MLGEKTLMVTDTKQSHKANLVEWTPKEILIGSDPSCTLVFADLEGECTVLWDGQDAYLGDRRISHGDHTAVNGNRLQFYLMDQQKKSVFDTAGKDYFSVSPYDYDDLTIETLNGNLVFYRDATEEGFLLEVHGGEVYHNYRRTYGNETIAYGDHVFVDGVNLIVNEESVEVFPSEKQLDSRLEQLVESDQPFTKNYPDYHRSPRIIHREPDEKQTIAKPSTKPSKPSEQIARMVVPPLVMIVALVIVSIIQPRGIFIIVMLAMTVTTVIFSITTYVKNVRQYKADMEHRDQSFRKYLRNKTKELYQVVEEQRHALEYHYPDVEEIRDMVSEVNARIYEKTVYHHDFLHFRAGLGTVDTSFEVEFRDEEFSQDEDELVDQARELRKTFRRLHDVPVVTSLHNGPVGYVGQRELLIEQIQLLVMQTAMFHSYHDVQFLTVFPEDEKDEWAWMRWLPHATLQSLNLRGFVYHERSRDQILHSMYQVLKQRKQTLEEKGDQREQTLFSPHYVFLITNEQLMIDHVIMEFLNEDPSELGVSIVFVQDVMQSLPEHVTTVIDIRDAQHGTIILEDGELVNKRFTPDHFPRDFDKEEVARGLAPLNHLQNLKNAIPESVTFLEMYGVKTVDELRIGERWNRNETYKTMAVPLGLRGRDDIVQLNLHEKAHGPHGLVAGTTGSGKSEIIQSYILSLAANFHPHEVAFLLIDYKGGGMANLFKNLPHLLGTITNLDRSQSMRALASIKAELEKRQRLFSMYDVNHINQYQKLFKLGEASEPMPHLFLISDEFAELKQEQPDFMKELVSTARIGRSLGIHLILATQKPSGVVDDQIWSNSKFKLALKVQNASDSNEVIKTPDAAEITQPGRAYLQVGNNEIYELFQSAWSGANYVPDQADHERVDTTIYAINDLGQYEILTEDLSGLGSKDEIERVPTELDAVIDHIDEYAQENGIERLPRPWLPPLPEEIFPEDIHLEADEATWDERKSSFSATIGMLDQPELQAQNPFVLDLKEEGHLAVFSSPQFGKSTFLQTLVMDLARQHNPEEMHTYLFDFGTNGLLPLVQLPHVADNILLDDTEKMDKWLRIITNEIRSRKRKLSEYGLANIDMYEAVSGEQVPTILIVIDQYDSVRDSEFGDEFERTITQIAREGGSIGIHLAISANRQTSMRMPLLTNIKMQIALYLIDETEIRAITGKHELEIEEIPGRGIVKQDEAALVQIALPTTGETNIERIENLKREAKQMQEEWQGELPTPIPVVPDTLPYKQFITLPQSSKLMEVGKVPIGVDFEHVLPTSFQQTQHIFVGSSDMLKIYELFKTLFDILSTQKQKGWIDELIYVEDDEKIIDSSKQETELVVSEKDQKEKVIHKLAEVLQRRKETDPAEYNCLYVLMPSCMKYEEELSSETLNLFNRLIEEADRYKMIFILGDSFERLSRSFGVYSQAVKKIKNVLSLSKVNDQTIFTVNNIGYREPQLGEQESYLIENEHAIKIKLPKIS